MCFTEILIGQFYTTIFLKPFLPLLLARLAIAIYLYPKTNQSARKLFSLTHKEKIVSVQTSKTSHLKIFGQYYLILIVMYFSFIIRDEN